MKNRELRQLIGFILFWLAVGMLFMMFVPNNFVGVLLAGALILTGYWMFCD